MKTAEANSKFKIQNSKFARAVSRCFAVQFFFFSLFAFIAEAQEIPPAQNFHQWGAVTIFNGLPSDNVRAIAQTSDGILWFGTDNGLARFDGRRVQTVALEADKILALEINSDESLWIGTNSGAFRLINNKFEHIEATKNFSITDFLFDENIFLATENGFILKLNKDDFQVEKIPAESLFDSKGNPLKITSLAKFGDKIIAGTRSPNVLMLENNRLSENFFRINLVNSLAQNADGKIRVGVDSKDSDSGFFELSGNGNLHKISAETGNVSALLSDAKGVFAGTGKKGLFYFQDGKFSKNFTFENTSGGLRSNTIYALFIDPEGVIWIGTNRGVSRFDASGLTTQNLSETDGSNYVRTFFRASDGRFFAGTNRGLFLQENENWIESENFSGKRIYAIGENSQKQVVFGLPEGLFDDKKSQILTGDIRAVSNLDKRTFAVIFGRGLVEIETNSLVFSNENITSVFSDGQKLVLGTGKDGIFFYDGKEIRQEKSLEILRGAAVWKIFADGENNFWFAGERGLLRYKNGELEQIISNQKVRDFIIIGENVWAGTSENGILLFKKDEIFGWISANLNKEQGLPSEQIFALLKEENRLFIGTNKGISIYTPGASAPKIIISRVLSQKLHGADEILQTINLEYPQNGLLTEVSGVSSRTFPEEFQYGFLLKNSKGEILEKKLSKDSQFAPTNLQAGGYTIEVRAFNKDLLASAPLTIRFSVARAPFPWTATALAVLLVIALIALIWAIIERRRIVLKNRELAAARFDLANEAERERKRIARDLHDQTLADLRNLMLKSDKFSAETSEFRTEIESVSTEIRRICEDLSPSVLENVGLSAALEFLLSHTIENHKFSAAENLEENLNFPPNVEMQIFRIAQEVLNNIKQHSDAEFVEMKIGFSPENRFLLHISDNGTFFNPSEKNSKGRGIANIKSRASLIEAEAFWEKGENGGNIFKLWKSTQNQPQ